MILDLRKRILIIAGIILLLILLLVFFLVRKPKAPVVEVQNPTSAVQADQAEVIDATQPREVILPSAPAPSTPEEKEKLFVLQLSRIFAERYLSYSNQADNNHINDVSTLITSRMGEYMNTQREEYSREYKGVTTKLISSSVAEFNNNNAKVTIGVQQILQTTQKTETAYKNGSVTLVKTQDGWKVDGLFWEE